MLCYNILTKILCIFPSSLHANALKQATTSSFHISTYSPFIIILTPHSALYNLYIKNSVVK
jgi:hypothetical protein